MGLKFIETPGNPIDGIDNDGDSDTYNTSSDIYDPENDDSEFINHNLENGLPEQLGKIDIINAMDVLEHVENIHDIFNDCFKKSEQKIAIALPNMAYYKFRLTFLFSGEISGKYIFHLEYFNT